MVIHAEGDTIYYTDRTAIETDDACGAKFWLSRKQNGRGISPIKEALALKVGRQIHEDFALIAEMEDLSPAAVDEVVRQATDPITPEDWVEQAVMEEMYRRLGWFAAYAIFIEPKVREIYENVSHEAEIILDRDPLWVAVTPDRVLRHRKEKYLVYREYKSTISASSKWMTSWTTSLQLMLGMKALEEELQEKIAFSQIIGLMKGDNRGGRLMHPYVWAYRDDKGKWEHDYNKARGGSWTPAPIWEYPGGIVDWVVRLGADVAAPLFPHSHPVFLNERMLNKVIEARTAREIEIAEVEDDCAKDEGMRNIYFPPRMRSCKPAFGDPCPFLAVCYNAAIAENPIASGLYEERTPHHTIELTLLGE